MNKHEKFLTHLVDPNEPVDRAQKYKIIGPGLVVAATGIGAADLVATLVAGSRYGYALMWAIVVGVIMKIVLVEGAGRYSLATGRTMFEGWRTLGRWTSVYFGPYILIWGFVYGATAMSSAAMPLAVLFPFLPLWGWAIIMGLIGFGMVWLGKYQAIEKITAVLVGLMFILIVGLALLTLPNVPALLKGLIPMIPSGGVTYTLALAGSVGGTITLAAYGYWLREKGWGSPRFMRVMQLDNTVAYLISGIFVASTLVLGVEVLYSAGVAVSTGDKGLLDLADVLKGRYGTVIGNLFLVGFWAASFSSIIGVWSGVSLMFADFWGNMRNKPTGHPDTMTGGKYFKFYLLWITFPPMLLFFLDRPIFLILLYGVLGALFMPFLAVTLLWILNTRRVPDQWRNGWFTNITLAVCAVLFVALGVYQTIDAVVKVL
ncbi:Nramp family divalent metal transporter [Rothia aerolata]|uniref:Iron transporter n=1 Tax=Rothia aerolata TaxID=1812262 RepID=A0A917MSF8_9MICC|nr:Nramp family divalent metal transporter [Rothia aerolata]GGH60852.1 iron transporter [Rothia aerolata]